MRRPAMSSHRCWSQHVPVPEHRSKAWPLLPAARQPLTSATCNLPAGTSAPDRRRRELRQLCRFLSRVAAARPPALPLCLRPHSGRPVTCPRPTPAPALPPTPPACLPCPCPCRCPLPHSRPAISHSQLGPAPQPFPAGTSAPTIPSWDQRPNHSQLGPAPQPQQHQPHPGIPTPLTPQVTGCVPTLPTPSAGWTCRQAK